MGRFLNQSSRAPLAQDEVSLDACIIQNLQSAYTYHRAGRARNSHSDSHGLLPRWFLHVGLGALSKDAAVIFFADEFKNLPGGMKFHFEVLGPGSSEDFRIVDGDLVRHRGWIDIPQAFDHMYLVAVNSQLVGLGIMGRIQDPFL